jgi:RimJ/RimL family protein N-acetyltransferase
MPSDQRIVFETERLRVRIAGVDDVDLFYNLWTEPRVMANVGFPQGLAVTRQEIEERLKRPANSEFERLLVAETKDTGQPIGECGMHRSNQESIAETDVKLLPSFWGHKYGVEIKRGLLAHLFQHTDCIAVDATPNVNNIASIRMQEEVGAVCVGKDVYHFPEAMRAYTVPVHHYTYRVYRTDWEQTGWALMRQGDSPRTPSRRTGPVCPTNSDTWERPGDQ